MRMKPQTQSKIMKIITSPLRALGKARDFYVKSMVGCAGRAGYGGTADYSSLPRSFSESSTRRLSDNNEDFRELMRAASARTLGERRVNGVMQQREAKVLPKSTSVVVMGRIDEDSACEFGDAEDVAHGKLYPRSRSYAVGKRHHVF